MVRCLTGWRNEDDSKQSSISIRRLYSAKISNSAKISSRLIPMINHYRPFERSFTLFVLYQFPRKELIQTIYRNYLVEISIDESIQTSDFNYTPMILSNPKKVLWVITFLFSPIRRNMLTKRNQILYHSLVIISIIMRGDRSIIGNTSFKFFIGSLVTRK